MKESDFLDIGMVKVVRLGRATPKSTRVYIILGHPSHIILYVNGAPYCGTMHALPIHPLSISSLNLLCARHGSNYWETTMDKADRNTWSHRI